MNRQPGADRKFVFTGGGEKNFRDRNRPVPEEYGIVFQNVLDGFLLQLPSGHGAGYPDVHTAFQTGEPVGRKTGASKDRDACRTAQADQENKQKTETAQRAFSHRFFPYTEERQLSWQTTARRRNDWRHEK